MKFTKSLFLKFSVFVIVSLINQLFAPPPYTHNAGNVTYTVNARGDTGFRELSWNGNPIIFGMSPLASIDGQLLMGNNAGETIGTVTEDQNATNASSLIEPGESSSEESRVFYGTSNINFQQNGFTYDESYGASIDLLEIEILVTNNSGQTINNMDVGMYFDFDIDGLGNAVGFDSSRGLYHQSNNNTYVGFGITSGPLHSAHFREYGVPQGADIISDGITDADTSNLPSDAVFYMSQRFSSVSAGSVGRVVIALSFATSLESLLQLHDFSLFNRGGGAVRAGGRVTDEVYGTRAGAPPIDPKVFDPVSGGGCVIKFLKKNNGYQKPRIWSLKIQD